jgi:hypothetical protein
MYRSTAIGQVVALLSPGPGADSTVDEARIWSANPEALRNAADRTTSERHRQFSMLRFVQKHSPAAVAVEMELSLSDVQLLHAQCVSVVAGRLTEEASGTKTAVARPLMPPDRAEEKVRALAPRDIREEALSDENSLFGRCYATLGSRYQICVKLLLVPGFGLDRAMAILGATRATVGAMQRRAIRELAGMLEAMTRIEQLVIDSQHFAMHLARFSLGEQEVLRGWLAGQTLAEVAHAGGRSNDETGLLLRRAVPDFATALSGGSPIEPVGGDASVWAAKTDPAVSP